MAVRRNKEGRKRDGGEEGLREEERRSKQEVR